MHLKEGTLLKGGTYKIIRFIASGGFGCTYEAVHPILGKRFAIKEFFPRTFCNREADTSRVYIGTQSQIPLVNKLKEKFINEAVAIAQLSHPGIVKVTDVFDENGTSYYVMDYIEGNSLAQIIKERGPLSEKETLKYIRQVCDALSFVHSKSRLHLDIKPGNIMIDEEGNATLIDFGASKQYDEESGENTSSLLGQTPGYAPLEQMGNDVKRFKPATDIYALGATMYKCLTGKTPLKANELADGEKLDPLPSYVSEATKNAFKAAMEVGSRNRPQTIKDFVTILDEIPKATNEANISEESTILDKHITPPKPKPIFTPTSDPCKKPSISQTNDIDKKPRITPIGETNKKPIFPQNNDIDLEESSTTNKKVKLYIGAASIIALIVVCFFAFGGNNNDKEVAEEDVIEANASQEKVNNNVIEDPYNGHEWVDLGLPSGLKWATCNVGANSPEDYGSYFAWGETKTKPSYEGNNSETYRKSIEWLRSNGYVDSIDNLTLSHDAAHQNWRGSWRMPTLEEIKELFANTTTTWTTRNGVKGRLVTSKKNGNSIFLPAAGWRYGSSSLSAGRHGYFWSSTPCKSDSESAYRFYFNSGYLYSGSNARYGGWSVRPVSE